MIVVLNVETMTVPQLRRLIADATQDGSTSALETEVESLQMEINQFKSSIEKNKCSRLLCLTELFHWTLLKLI